jgi:predicted nucleotidyltransferase
MDVDVEKEIESIARQIIEKYQPEKIILFGSAARKDSGEINDLDFLVIKRDVPLHGIDRMRELDRVVDRNIAADMLVYRPDEIQERLRLGDPFIKMILKEGRVLYG